MTEQLLEAATTDLPSPERADRIVRTAQGLFRRSLAGWASDMLELRRTGGARAAWIDAHDEGGQWSRAA